MPNCEGKALVSGISFTWILILASNNFVGKSFENEIENHSVVSDSLLPHGLYSPWNSPGQNTGVDSLSLLQGVFPILGQIVCSQMRVLKSMTIPKIPDNLVLLNINNDIRGAWKREVE